MTWRISTDARELQLDLVYPWLRASYWSPNIRRDVVERAFANSVVVGAYDPDGRQLGVARAATDRATLLPSPTKTSVLPSSPPKTS